MEHGIKTAIVIDDSPEIVDFFCEWLETYDISVVAKGYDGREAIELYLKFKPDIVFLDIIMPHYDGFYTIESIKKIDPQARIVVVTADLHKDTLLRLENYGIHTVYKPFQYDDFNLTLEQLTQIS